MRRALLSVLAISIVALVLVGYLFWRDMSRSFPDLPQGVYVGMVLYERQDIGVPLYIERGTRSPALLVALGDQTTQAQYAPIQDPLGKSRLPLIVTGGESRLRLSGIRKDDKRYEGECLDPIKNRRGTWYLQKVEIDEGRGREDSDLSAWVALVTELQKVEGAIEKIKRRYDSQKTKMERLSRFLVDDESLREKATSRLSSTSSALDGARTDLGKVRATLDATIRNVEISQRVSPAGRLAFLSRESLLRESRWIEITLKLLAPETTPGFEEQLERANRIKAVQDEINEERRRIEEIDTLDRYRGTEDETSTEEEFYRGLQ
jgi:hypothetical protein